MAKHRLDWLFDTFEQVAGLMGFSDKALGFGFLFAVLAYRWFIWERLRKPWASYSEYQEPIRTVGFCLLLTSTIASPFAFPLTELDRFRLEAIYSDRIVAAPENPTSKETTLGDACPNDPCFKFWVNEWKDDSVQIVVKGTMAGEVILPSGETWGPFYGVRSDLPLIAGQWYEMIGGSRSFRVVVEDDSRSHTVIWFGVAESGLDPWVTFFSPGVKGVGSEKLAEHVAKRESQIAEIKENPPGLKIIRQ